MATTALPYTITSGTEMQAAQVQGNDEALRDGINAVVSGSGGTVPDTLMTSPNNTVYKTLLRGGSVAQTDLVAGTYFFVGSALEASPFDASAAEAPSGIYLDDADFTVGGKTTKLRVRAQVSTNATVPAITFTAGLYPVTFAGAADTLTATLGTVVASSTVAIASPAASSTTSGVSSDFNVPADGLYCLGVVTSATLTNNNRSMVTAALQTRNV